MQPGEKQLGEMQLGELQLSPNNSENINK